MRLIDLLAEVFNPSDIEKYSDYESLSKGIFKFDVDGTEIQLVIQRGEEDGYKYILPMILDPSQKQQTKAEGKRSFEQSMKVLGTVTNILSKEEFDMIVVVPEDGFIEGDEEDKSGKKLNIYTMIIKRLERYGLLTPNYKEYKVFIIGTPVIAAFKTTPPTDVEKLITKIAKDKIGIDL